MFYQLSALAILLWSTNASAQCDQAITKNFSSKYWSVVERTDLNDDDKVLWDKYHLGLCPGITTVVWGSDKRTYYALALLHKSGEGKVFEKLLLVDSITYHVKARLSGAAAVSNPFVVWTAKAGTFADRRTGQIITIRGESVIYEEMESTATQFYMHRGRIRSLIAAD